MNFTVRVVANLVLLFTTSFIFGQETYNFIGIDKIADFEKEAKGRFFKTQHESQSSDVDVHYVSATWQVDPDNRYISGTIKHTLKVTSNKSSINFDLDNDLVVDKITVNEQEVAFTRQNHQITVNYLPGFVPATDYQVSITYHGTPPSSGFGSFMTATHEGTPVLWTLSEPYGARDWWPCMQNLSDKIDSLDVFVSVKPGIKVASNGLLQSVTPSDDLREVHHWKHRYPIATYLVAIAATNYLEITDSVQLSTGNLFVQHYIYPENNKEARPQDLKNTIRFLQIFDSLFTPYPFMKEKYGHAEFGWGGGMEHQTMSFMGTFQYQIVAHELAHQWFGDMVTCGKWEDIWLNEGFATYLAALVFNVETPDLWWQKWKRDTKKAVTSKPNGSVFVDNIESVSRIFDSRLTYSKGAFLLHMLRWTLGDDVFFSAIRNYLNNPDLKERFAVTDDLKWELEKASGKDLDYFFDQWFYGEGYPTYTLQWNEVGKAINVKVSQTQSDTANSVNFFRMDLPLRFKNATSDTIVRLENTYDGQVFTISLGFSPDSVILDPEIWLLMGLEKVIKKDKIDVEVSVIFPNPATQLLNIVFDEPVITNEIEIYNAVGQRLPFETNTCCDHLIQIDVSNLPAGVYLVKNGSAVIGKFVKIQ